MTLVDLRENEKKKKINPDQNSLKITLSTYIRRQKHHCNKKDEDISTNVNNNTTSQICFWFT